MQKARPSGSCLLKDNELSGNLSLDFDLDINASWQFDALKRIDGLAVWLDNVDKALMDTHLEVLA
jgi:hypothetical protein